MDFDFLLNQLLSLKTNLKRTANRLWWIRLRMAQSPSRLFGEDDFLPRRLQVREKEEAEQFDWFVRQFHTVLQYSVKDFVMFNSDEDMDSMREIQKTVRYIQNAFAGGLRSGHKWVQLQRSLPSPTKH